MDKEEREIAGVKVFVSNESYNQYKGTLQEQINDLQQRISKAVEYINKNIAIYHKQLPLIAIDYEEVISILKGDDTNES